MNWQVVARPQAENDLIEAAEWYDSQRYGLGDEFIDEILTVFDTLKVNPLLHCPPSDEEYPLALSQAISLSRDLRSD